MKIQSNIDESIFREYDIRGIYPKQIDKNVAYTIGKSFGSYIKKFNQKKCIVGYDIRESSLELSVSLILGILSSGADVINLGLVTTPMFLYARDVLNIECAIMVTASHNPKEYNGFKFCINASGLARGEMIENFRDFTLKGDFDEGIGHIGSYRITNDYLKAFKENIDIGPKRIKAVVDLANATTTVIAKDIFDMFNIDVCFINEEPDSSFPNHHPDPFVAENQKQLQQKVKELKYDIGIGFDGDGDRVGIVDDNGDIVDADKVMAIQVDDIIKNNDNKKILYDVKCSQALVDKIIECGGEPVKCRTGASYTMAEVIVNNLPFGGELSGHIFYNDRIKTFGSGIYAGLRVVELLSKTDKKLSELTSGLNKYYNSYENFNDVDDNIKYKIIKDIKEYCIHMRMDLDLTDGVYIKFEDGSCLMRASNTTPIITARFEASSEERLFGIKKEFSNLVKYFIKQNKNDL